MSEMGMTQQFQWTPQQPSSHHFEMQDGIMHVWTDDSKSEMPFALPGTALDFFSDMHRSLLQHLTLLNCLFASIPRADQGAHVSEVAHAVCKLSHIHGAI